MRPLQLISLSLLAGVLGLAGPAAAQQAAQARIVFDPAADDPRALAELAAAAGDQGRLPELRAWLDSLRVAGLAGRHALAYWGALSLQEGAEPDSVAIAFARHLAVRPANREALAALVEVLEANGAIEAAGKLRELAGRRDALEGLAEERETRPAVGLEPVRTVPQGDLHLARGRPDSAVAVYAAAANAGPRSEALEALERVRLVHAIQRARLDGSFLAALGRALIAAPGDPSAGAARLDSLAGILGSGDSTGVARALLAGVAGEWLGRAGDPTGASHALESAARDAGHEGAGLLIAAGRWAMATGDPARAAKLWREVVERHPETAHDLEARRLLTDHATGGAR